MLLRLTGDGSDIVIETSLLVDFICEPNGVVRFFLAPCHYLDLGNGIKICPGDNLHGHLILNLSLEQYSETTINMLKEITTKNKMSIEVISKS